MFKKKQKDTVTNEEMMKKLEKLEIRMDKLMRYQLDIVNLMQNILWEKDPSKNINVKISKN